MTTPKSNAGQFNAAYDLKNNEQTKDYYSQWAESYDQEIGKDNAYAQPSRVADMLHQFLPNADAYILDAGCGSGLSGEALTKSGYRNVHGRDFSLEMLAKAEQKNVYASLGLADLNAGQPEIENSSFDAVTCVGVFSFGHVFPDACDDLLRILRTGGFLIIAVNQQYWDEGDLEAKITILESDRKIAIRAEEFGDHLPGKGVMGWVLALEKLT